MKYQMAALMQKQIGETMKALLFPSCGIR